MKVLVIPDIHLKSWIFEFEIENVKLSFKHRTNRDISNNADAKHRLECIGGNECEQL